MITPKIPLLKDGQILSVDVVNSIIKRTEYAGDLLKQYKLIAGNEMYVEPHYDGTRVSYLQPVGGGGGGGQAGSLVFVSVIDESSVSSPILQEWATAFIAEYGLSRPIYVLCPNIPAIELGLDQLRLELLPAAVGILVGRTDIGGPVTDWLSLLPSATEYRVAIDNSGSMSQATVQASLTLFLQRCASANRTVTVVNMSQFGVENWIASHIGF
jgi:hypothetical protein